MDGMTDKSKEEGKDQHLAKSSTTFDPRQYKVK